MKVLFLNRPDCYSQWGGDTTQMVRTAEALRTLGVEVDVPPQESRDFADYDLVHVFNLQLPHVGIRYVQRARALGKPVALSTIFWDMRHLQTPPPPPPFGIRFRQRVGRVLRRLRVLRPLPSIAPTAAFEMLSLAGVLLPNSHAELEQLVLAFGLPELRSKAWVVPNAAELENDDGNSPAEWLKDLPAEFVLEAARFEPFKGQRQLIEGLRGWPELPLVLVGGLLQSPFGDELRRLAAQRGNTFLLPGVAQTEMRHFYRRARVHALPSLRESPGLATLEAALYGANCVVSFHAPVSEYFMGDAWICNPMDPVSVGHAVHQAWHAPRTGSLGTRVREHHSYTVAARATLRAYEWLLGDSRVSHTL